MMWDGRRLPKVTGCRTPGGVAPRRAALICVMCRSRPCELRKAAGSRRFSDQPAVEIEAAGIPREDTEMMQQTHPIRSPMLIAALLVAAGFAVPTRAQDQSAATPSDTIFARKTVMDTISEKMDALEAASASDRKIDLAAAHEFADVISVLLMAFPHMFPAATNQWKPNVEKDPAVDTYAAPELWTRFADFYKRAGDASKIAFNASRATGEAEFKAAVVALRGACDGCHAAYQKTD
jgi:cytochrome c556